MTAIALHSLAMTCAQPFLERQEALLLLKNQGLLTEPMHHSQQKSLGEQTENLSMKISVAKGELFPRLWAPIIVKMAALVHTINIVVPPNQTY